MDSRRWRQAPAKCVVPPDSRCIPVGCGVRDERKHREGQHKSASRKKGTRASHHNGHASSANSLRGCDHSYSTNSLLDSFYVILVAPWAALASCFRAASPSSAQQQDRQFVHRIRATPAPRGAN